MSAKHATACYAKMDPAHLLDGVFVPTNGLRRKAEGKDEKGRDILMRPRMILHAGSFNGTTLRFQGIEQLGADDQSLLLAISAQLGIDGLMIDATPDAEVSKQLRLNLEITGANSNTPVAAKKTSLRSLLIDAGYKHVDNGRSIENARASLNRLRNTQIREIHKSGWDRAANLISTEFNMNTGEIYIATNPRLTSAIFAGQNIQVSLFERNRLDSEVAKLLHCWLCSNIRLGKSLGNGNGTAIDTLGPHIWGAAGWEAASAPVKSKRRGLIRDALEEVADRTRVLHSPDNEKGYGWAIDVTKTHAYVSRPKTLPIVEKFAATPGQLSDEMFYDRDTGEFGIDLQKIFPDGQF